MHHKTVYIMPQKWYTVSENDPSSYFSKLLSHLQIKMLEIDVESLDSRTDYWVTGLEQTEKRNSK